LTVFAGAGLLALALLIWMATTSVQRALHGESHDNHDHDHAPQGLGPSGGAVITVLLAAIGGVLLQLLPGGADGSWFNTFLGLSQGEAATAAPGLATLLALTLALLAIHSVLSVLLLSRATSENTFSERPFLRALYTAASNRLWVDAVIHARLLRLILALSERLARIDLRLARGVLDGAAKGAATSGDAIGWLDTVPRRAAEALPGAMSLQLAEATRHVEQQATEGFGASVDRTTGRMGRMALVVERALGRPVVSVGVIILVALIALAGA
jgi:hypothetical protein